MNIKKRNFLFAAMRFLGSILLGVLSVWDKHHPLFYLTAPTLNVGAGLFQLSPSGVMLGQLCSVFVPQSAPMLPILCALWLLPFAYPAHQRVKKRFSPLLLGVLLCVWEVVRRFFGIEGDLASGICGGILSACFLYFLAYICGEVNMKARLDGKGFTACLISSIFALMLFDGTALDGLPTQIAALLLILLGAFLDLWQCLLGGSLVALGGALIGGDATVLPMYLSAVAAVCTMQKWGKRTLSGAVALCALLALLPGRVFLEHPLWLISAPAASIIYLLLPLRPKAKRFKAPTPSLNGQYEALVRQVDKLQKSAKGRILFYPEITERATTLLQQAGAQNIRVTCAKDLLGGFFLDVSFEGSDLTKAALLGLMERAAGFSLTPRQCYIKKQGSYASFVRRAPFSVQCAALCKTKEGETVCGDSALAFSADQAHYILLLSDGMGSGKDAFAQSFWTITLLQKLLRAGLKAEGALGMVHSSLRLASEDVAFATADLCSINLWTGQAQFVKAGALSSFILRGQQIIEVSAASMPLGASESPDVAVATEVLQENDLILLISDGAYESKDHLLYAFQKYRELPIDALARRLMQCTSGDSEKTEDDITVLVARFCTNK